MAGAAHRRALALLLLAAGLLAAGPLLSGLHYLTVRHFYCAEHHALAHGEEGHGHGPAPSGRPALTAAGGDEDTSLGHDECSSHILGRRIDLPLGVGLVPLGREGPSLSTSPRRERAAIVVSVLDVAPKVSPPSPVVDRLA
jgi:hypothetical protein